ncbi:integral membrane sensor signal transduction histidine kinase [Desulfarculus baarsii DSM 2075]|uniref:histidine kinase n=1 Tax=Desulfarculus baarsii (strain ATCC 33931 / DSM 2075 / LMG 7858 / VKM B-1802 / 2st14) TaxID=644282 RepID=E1QD66_DESB2|nr:cache domain-containing protein [Desulfarculus baarsii]ADK83385.1 integral membrane sensor signal transduction histidine kinase [Desulfarculus baarsii DSM 2075]
MNLAGRLWRSTRVRLIVSFVAVALLVGVASFLVGGRLLYEAVLSEAASRVRLDLNAAREIYQSRTRSIELALSVAIAGDQVQRLLTDGDAAALKAWLDRLAREAGLDFLGLAARDGRVLARIGPGPLGGRDVDLPVVAQALAAGRPMGGTVVMDAASLAAEDPALARRAVVRPVATARADPAPEGARTEALCLAAAAPLSREGLALYGGVLLSRDKAIVDTVGQTVFKNESFAGRQLGTATIFLGDLRVSTNVRAPDGSRAIGTRASREVAEEVLGRGGVWSGRAFVAYDWQITAYEPIVDVNGQRVGMLYVGVLEAKYAGLWRQTLMVFALTTLACLVVAVGLGAYLAERITRPVNQLIAASERVARGDFSPEVGPIVRSDLGLLQRGFQEMLLALGERERRQQEESEKRLLQSEKQALVGRLAAGVAHEINNPLTGVLTFTHLLLRRGDLPAEVVHDLQTIAAQTERVRKIVKGLLDFSRQTKLEAQPSDLNPLVAAAVKLMTNQALLKGVRLHFDPQEEFPVMNLDRSQMQGVLINMIINALDATPPGGEVAVITRPGDPARRGGRQGVEILVRDTGCGIAPEHLDKLFDPFFTTKEVGQGTGLGLAVSQGVVARHGGEITVRSKPGQGSTFTIWLPEEIRSEGYDW